MWQGLKWVIRDLRLNTGQNFWKNHVTREDLQKVIFCISVLLRTWYNLGRYQ